MSINNIVLIGFMGSGKTTIGRKLAKKLGYTFLDADGCIEEHEKQTVKDIFHKKGEAYFRQLETELLKQWLTYSQHIFSTGGGMVLKSENVQLMRNIGQIIYLKTSPQEISRRLMHDTSRPLLLNEDKETKILKIKNLLEKRKAFYETAAEICIETDGKSTATIVKEIEGYL